MRLVRYDVPRDLYRAAAPWLTREPYRHNLVLGLLATLIERPEVYPTFELWAVEEERGCVGAALRTPPHPLVLAMPSGPRALEVLVDGLLERGEKIPGVVGALPEADHFAERYAAAAGVRAASRMDQGVHVLEAVESVPQPSGRVRAARPGDLDRILTWTRAFARESLPAEAWDEDEARRRLASRLRGEGGAYRFWEDGAPVCFAGTVAGTGGGGVRIGPVYTPPARRRRGYATALVAAASREALQGGAPFCLLTTDLANPTSNAIYRRIGYRRVHDAAMIAFAPPSSGAS